MSDIGGGHVREYEPRAGCVSRWYNRPVRYVRLVVVLVACMLGVSACSSSGRPYASSVAVRNDPVLLVPDVEAGNAGWCIRARGGEECANGPTREPIISESWSKSGPPLIWQGYALTLSRVTSVLVDHRRLPTRRESVLPDGLRVVVVEIHGTLSQSTSEARATELPRFTPLSVTGEPIRELKTRHFELLAEDQSFTQSFASSPRPSTGICGLDAESLAGLEERNARVVTNVRTYGGLIGEGFLACASASYRLDDWPLLAGVLISASHPGVTPPALPAMQPLAGHLEVFQAPALGGEMVARRIPGAWLVVEGGKLEQRLKLLEHLRATVRA